VASPAEEIVATGAVAVQVTRLVRSRVVPLVKVPCAENCTVFPAATVVTADCTLIDAR